MLAWIGLYGPSGKLLARSESDRDLSDLGMLLQSLKSKVSLEKINAPGKCVLFVWLPSNFVFILVIEHGINILEKRNWKECAEFIFEAQCHGLTEEYQVARHFDIKLAKIFLESALILPAEIGILEGESSLIIELLENKIICASRALPALGFLDYQLFFSVLFLNVQGNVLFRLPNLSDEGFVRVQIQSEGKRLLINN